MSYITMSNIDVTMGIIIFLQVSEENSFSDSKHDLPVLEIKVIQEGHLDDLISGICSTYVNHYLLLQLLSDDFTYLQMPFGGGKSALFVFLGFFPESVSFFISPVSKDQAIDGY